MLDIFYFSTLGKARTMKIFLYDSYKLGSKTCWKWNSDGSREETTLEVGGGR